LQKDGVTSLLPIFTSADKKNKSLKDAKKDTTTKPTTTSTKSADTATTTNSSATINDSVKDKLAALRARTKT